MQVPLMKRLFRLNLEDVEPLDDEFASLVNSAVVAARSCSVEAHACLSQEHVVLESALDAIQIIQELLVVHLAVVGVYNVLRSEEI